MVYVEIEVHHDNKVEVLMTVLFIVPPLTIFSKFSKKWYFIIFTKQRQCDKSVYC